MGPEGSGWPVLLGTGRFVEEMSGNCQHTAHCPLYPFCIKARPLGLATHAGQNGGIIPYYGTCNTKRSLLV